MAETAIITVRPESGCLVAVIEVPRISEGPTLDAVQAKLAELTTADPAGKILIDFRQVELMSSATLAVLVRFYRDLVERGGRIALCGLQQPVRKTFELTRLDQLFRIEPDIPAGLARLTE